MDRQDMTKFVIAYRNFANAPENHTPNCHCSYRDKLWSYFSARHVVLWGKRGIAPLVLTLGTRLIWVVNFTPMPLYSRGSFLQNTWGGGWVAPTVGLDTLDKKKSISSARNRTAIPRSSSLVTLLINLARHCHLRQPVPAQEIYGISP